MNHGTLKALYQLDVAEVGEEEAAKRWEFMDAMHSSFQQCIKAPSWGEFIQYRRKPGITWPKVMQQPIDINPETMLKLISTINYLVGIAERGVGRRIKSDETPEQFILGYVKSLEAMKPPTQWPDDAPEWANYMATDSNGQVWLYETKPVLKRVYWLQGEVVGKSDPYNNAVPNWRDTLIERPKPAKQKCKCCGQEVE